MVDYKGYLPLDPESIGEKPIDEQVQERRDILQKKEQIVTFDPGLDDLLIEKDEPTDSTWIVESRGSNKEIDPIN